MNYLLLLYKIAKFLDQFIRTGGENYSLSSFSSETVSFFLPLALLAANTFLPSGLAIRVRNPCLLVLFRLEGWNVLFVIALYFLGLQK